MIERRTQVLVSSVRKLARRGAWKNIERIVRKAHTADIGALLQGLEADERLPIFRLIQPLDKRAGVLSYLELETQTELLLALDRKDAHKLVEKMDTDDAADLLGHIPEDVSKEILESMVEESSEEVADLMRYPDDSAGGLMSSDFLPLREEMTVSEAIHEIQSQREDAVVTFYVYVVNETGRLVGVLSLKNLILSKPAVVLREIMSTDTISATTEMTQREVAALVEKYDFLSVPVIDTSGTLVGVITVDDVIDVIREEGKEEFLSMGRAGGGEEESTYEHLRARLPWLALSYLGGMLCFLLLGQIVDLTPLPLVGFLPLLLAMGSTSGQQSGTVTVGAFKGETLDLRLMREHLSNEARIALSVSAIFGVATWAILAFHFHNGASLIAIAVAAALAIQVTLSMILGSAIPLLMRNMGMDPTVVSVPLLLMFSDLASVAVLFRVARGILGS